MLIPHYEGAMTNEERSDIYSCSTKKPDHRLNKILDLNSFMKVFGIYKSVMTEVYQQRQKELDLYERNIIDMGMRYSGSGFYEYHKQFSAKAVACLQQHQGWTNKPYDCLVCLKVTQNYSREPVFHSPENGQQNIMYCRSSCVQKFNYCTNLELTSKQTSWTYRAQFIRRHIVLVGA